jgi:hypothetical protein
LSDPFPDWEAGDAYHCLTQVQKLKSKYFHLHIGAVSPKGNLVALVEGSGDICLIPIHTRSGGGMESDIKDPPVDVKSNLNKVKQPLVAIQFNSEGDMFIGADWSGRVIVGIFPEEPPRSSQSSTLQTRRDPTGERLIHEDSPGQSSSSQSSTPRPRRINTGEGLIRRETACRETPEEQPRSYQSSASRPRRTPIREGSIPSNPARNDEEQRTVNPPTPVLYIQSQFSSTAMSRSVNGPYWY